MSSDFRQFDDHGLPLPQKFVDMRAPDEESPRKPKFTQRSKRIFLLVLVIGVIVPIVFGPQIVSTVRQTLGRWLQSRADRKLMEGDNRGALVDLNQAIGWNSDAWDLYAQRSAVREQLNDLDGSLADLTKAIDLLRDVRDNRDRRRRRGVDRNSVLAYYHARRSWINVRLERPTDAIEDATDAIELDPLSASNLNTRAYARAVCKIELNEGLADVDKALDRARSDPRIRIADFLDTRGYLLHLLKRNDEALTELNRAISMTEANLSTVTLKRAFVERRDTAQMRAEQEEYNHALAVMYHHRGLVRQELNDSEAAQKDLQRAEELGYNPANGVF